MHVTKRILTVMLAVCLLVSTLPVPATAEDTPTYYCGKAAHGESCYGSVTTCTQAEHTHGDECTEVKDLTCGKTEVEAHTHGDCEEGCTLTQAHEHVEGCTVEGELTCGYDEAHTHGDTCYTVTRPACTVTEHTHTAEANCFSFQLTCQDETHHDHVDGCTVAPCNKGEDCPASTHEEGCLKAAADLEAAELAKCDQQKTCPATLHKDGCLKAALDAEEAAKRELCTKEENCPAQLHKEDCVKAANDAAELAKCTGLADCTANLHKDGCAKIANNVGPESCTKLETCPADTHEAGCLKAANDAELAKCTQQADCPATLHQATCPKASGGKDTFQITGVTITPDSPIVNEAFAVDFTYTGELAEGETVYVHYSVVDGEGNEVARANFVSGSTASSFLGIGTAGTYKLKLSINDGKYEHKVPLTIQKDITLSIPTDTVNVGEDLTVTATYNGSAEGKVMFCLPGAEDYTTEATSVSGNVYTYTYRVTDGTESFRAIWAKYVTADGEEGPQQAVYFTVKTPVTIPENGKVELDDSTVSADMLAAIKAAVTGDNARNDITLTIPATLGGETAKVTFNPAATALIANSTDDVSLAVTAAEIPTGSNGAAAYDLSLGGVAFDNDEVTGEVTVYLPLPDSLADAEKIKVTYWDDEGKQSNEEFEAGIDGEEFWFKTSHFSTFVVADGETPYDWYTEAEGDTYEISTIEELKELALITQGKAKDADGNAISTDNFSGKTVTLMDNLTFDADDYWYYKDSSKTIDYRISTFAGTFDGNDKTISGLKFSSNTGMSSVGLFQRIDGSIKDLTLDGVSFALCDTNTYVGSIAGSLYGTATNCHVKNVTVVVGMRNETRGYIAQGGGMFGYIKSATVTGCTATTVNMTFSGTDNTDRVGALIGQADGTTDNRSTISGCTVTGATFNCTCKTKHFGAFVGQTHHTDVTECHIYNINITTQTYSYNTGGFVGNVGTGSVFSTCTVSGFNMIDNASNGIAGNVGGFAGYVGGTDISFTGCSATGLEFDLEFANDYDFGVGGFAGKVHSNGATFSGCSASGNIDAHSAGNADIPVGGFVGESNGNLTVSGCSTSVNVTAPEVAGGFVGACNSGTDTYTNCEATGSVTGTEGVAGGMVGYIKADATPTFESCTPASSVTGPIASDVAYSQNKIYDQDADGDITSESTSWVCSVKLNRSYTIGYASIQAAVDAGADNVTLLQNVTGDFNLDRTKDDSFTLNLGEFTFNGKVHIHDMLGSFAVTGNAEGSQILLTAPLGIHDAFDGWCHGSNDVNEFADKADKDHWIAVPGNSYHIHYHDTDLSEIEAAQRHLDLGRMGYDAATPNSASITFSYKEGVTGTSLISSFEENDYFVGSGVNSLTATFQPKPGLAAGVYEDIPMYVIMSDGSSHKIWLNLVVTAHPSQVEPEPDPDTGSVVIDATYGDTIELTVKVSKSEQGKPKGRMTMPAVDTAAFYYGEELLGEVEVDYEDDRTATTGTATLRYDTNLNGIPVGNGQTITVAYGGSVNLLASTGSITVNLKAKTIAKGETVTFKGVTVTGPATQDQENIYVNQDGKAEVGGNEFTVTSGMAVVTPDGAIQIVDGATVTTPDGKVITGPASISPDGQTILVHTGGKITDGGVTYTVTSGTVSLTDGVLTIPDECVITDGTNTFVGPTVIDPDSPTIDLPEGSTIVLPNGPTVNVESGTVTGQPDGSLSVPEDTTVTVGDVTVTGPATVGTDGKTTVEEGGIIVNGDTTVEVEEGSVTVSPDGSIEIPEEAQVTVNDIPVTGPASIDAEGQTITVEKGGSFTIGKDTYTVSKGTASVYVSGAVYVPKGSSVKVNGKTYDGPLTITEDGIRFIYEIIKGKDATVRKGDPLTVVANFDYDKFEGVLIDGVELNKKHYISKSGSTIVTISSEYIETLKTGRPYTITLLAEDGEAATTFTVKSAASSSGSSSDKDYDSDSPKTGDITNTQTWLLLALVGLAGILATLLTKKFLLKRK